MAIGRPSHALTSPVIALASFLKVIENNIALFIAKYFAIFGEKT